MIDTHIYVFYGHQLYTTLQYTPSRNEVPEGSLLYFPIDPFANRHWYSMDLCPVLLEDVPKPVRALVLLMGI